MKMPLTFIFIMDLSDNYFYQVPRAQGHVFKCPVSCVFVSKLKDSHRRLGKSARTLRPLSWYQSIFANSVKEMS